MIIKFCSIATMSLLLLLNQCQADVVVPDNPSVGDRSNTCSQGSDDQAICDVFVYTSDGWVPCIYGIPKKAMDKAACVDAQASD